MKIIGHTFLVSRYSTLILLLPDIIIGIPFDKINISEDTAESTGEARMEEESGSAECLCVGDEGEGESGSPGESRRVEKKMATGHGSSTSNKIELAQFLLCLRGKSKLPLTERAI